MKKEIDWYEKTKGRVKDWKNNKVRVGLSIVVLIFAIALLPSHIQQKEAKDYPVPTIEILSSTDDLGVVDTYALEFSATNTEYAEVQNKRITPDSDGIFRTDVNLPTSYTTIEIVAHNKYKQATETVRISREKTEQELAWQAEWDQDKIDRTIEELQETIDSLNVYNGGENRTSVDFILIETVVFGTYADTIEEARSLYDPEVDRLANQLEQRVSSIQIQEFPKMRKAYADVVAAALWENDIDVTVTGSGNNTIVFTGATFASNANISASFSSDVKDTLEALRFDRATYKWFEYDSEPTTYELDSLADSKVSSD